MKSYKYPKVNNGKEELKGYPSFKLIFVTSVMPFWVIALFVILMLFYFPGVSRDISVDSTAHKSSVQIIVSKYPSQFTSQQVNSSKEGQISPEISHIAVMLLHRINDQLIYSLIPILIIGNFWAFRRAQFLSKDYKQILQKPACITRQQESVKAAATFSTSVSGAVSVGLTIIGAA